jgi:hypothetical protein
VLTGSGFAELLAFQQFKRAFYLCEWQSQIIAEGHQKRPLAGYFFMLPCKR